MGNEQAKILDSIWFTSLGDSSIIGIVKIDTGYGTKWYIGSAEGTDQKYDEQYIAQWGTPIFPNQLKEFFGIEENN